MGFILQNLCSCVFKPSERVQGPFQIPISGRFYKPAMKTTIHLPPFPPVLGSMEPPQGDPS